MKLKIEVANGGDPAGEKQAARRAAKAAKPADLDLIDKIIAQFLKRQASGYQPNTLGEVSRIMNWEILPAWRGRCLSSITAWQVPVIDHQAGNPRLA